MLFRSVLELFFFLVNISLYMLNHPNIYFYNSYLIWYWPISNINLTVLIKLPLRNGTIPCGICKSLLSLLSSNWKKRMLIYHTSNFGKHKYLIQTHYKHTNWWIPPFYCYWHHLKSLSQDVVNPHKNLSFFVTIKH